MYILRSYQADAVKAIVHYFRHHLEPAVAVLPTGAGKSLVIAELAKIARGRVLVLAHVKELVEQNHEKYEGYGLKGDIFSAGLGRKESNGPVVFASIQSVVRHLDDFIEHFSLLIIDECHRVPDDENSSYRKVITYLQSKNNHLKILGFTATPYRLGLGWIYQYHLAGKVCSTQTRFFKDCIFDLPIQYLLDEGYLTKPILFDAPILSYDFSSLKSCAKGLYNESQLDEIIKKSPRATPKIVNQIKQFAQNRQGVMIFAATIKHAQEIVSLLPTAQTALVIGDTLSQDRENIIKQFKQRTIKYLVNVSVLTTGFDAPHVDLIAILRPTMSASLYQQIAGRGLRLSEGKKNCLILDYAGNVFSLDQNQIDSPQPDKESDIVTVPCPACGFNNNFWGKLDQNGFLLEHFGRRCQGFFIDDDGEREICGYRFRAKYCNECGAENDIAARQCQECDNTLVDPDKKLKQALALKDAMIFACQELTLTATKNKNGKPQLNVIYQDKQGAVLQEVWPLANQKQKRDFLTQFITPHLVDRHRPFTETAPTKVVSNAHRLRPPDIIIARKNGRFWKIRDKLFDLHLYSNCQQLLESRLHK